MAVNLATKYSAKLDQIFSHASYTDAYVNKDYDFDGVQTVKVWTVTTTAPVNYDRTSTTDRFGGLAEVQDTVATYTVANDKAFKLAIDNGNNSQQLRAKQAAKVLKLEIQEQIVPMIDKDRIATAATAANAASNKVTATADGYADFLSMGVFLDEAQVPVAGRVCFVTPAYYKEIKSQIVTSFNTDTYGSALLTKGFKGELDGCPVVMVPSSYFPSKTKAVMWHKDALLGVKQITKSRIKEDSEMIDGAILLGRYVFDTFALAAKSEAFASVVSAS